MDLEIQMGCDGLRLVVGRNEMDGGPNGGIALIQAVGGKNGQEWVKTGGRLWIL